MIIIRKNGKVVSTSKNLRGILRYSATIRRDIAIACDTREPWRVASVHVLETPSGALLRVRWSDGAYAVARFASCTVARIFAQHRRNWPLHRYTPLHSWHAPTRAD